MKMGNCAQLYRVDTTSQFPLKLPDGVAVILDGFYTICVFVADLEKTVPEVSVDFWSRVMGRCPEDTQAEIENRIAKRGIHLLKKYSEYHKFLSERLFRLNASTFSTADKCIFYIGKK